jgi:hypothetical protein
VDTCTSISAIQLLAAAFGFLLVVLSLDMFWVRATDHTHIDGALRKRGVCTNGALCEVGLGTFLGECGYHRQQGDENRQ